MTNPTDQKLAAQQWNCRELISNFEELKQKTKNKFKKLKEMETENLSPSNSLKKEKNPPSADQDLNSTTNQPTAPIKTHRIVKQKNTK